MVSLAISNQTLPVVISRSAPVSVEPETVAPRQLAKPQEDQPKEAKGKFFLPELAVQFGYFVAPVLHVLAGATRIFLGSNNPISNALGKWSLRFTKTINSLNYIDKGQDALRHNRSWDAAARFIYPAVVQGASVEDVFGLTGLSSGISMHTDAQKARVKVGLQNQGIKYNQGFDFKILKEEFIQNLKVNLKMLKDLFTGGLFGKNRKVFVSEDKETGHTMALGGHLNFSGGVLTLLNILTKKSIAPLRILASIVRNAGSLISDYAKLFHPDPNHRKAAYYYVAVSIFDFIQSLVSQNMAETLGHFSQAFANRANYYYVNTSRATTNNTFADYELNKMAKVS